MTMMPELYEMPNDALILKHQAVALDGQPTGAVYYEYRGVGELRERRELYFADHGEAALWAFRRKLLYVNSPIPCAKIGYAEYMSSGESNYTRVLEAHESHGVPYSKAEVTMGQQSDGGESGIATQGMVEV